jgi:hypothetical protein
MEMPVSIYASCICVVYLRWKHASYVQYLLVLSLEATWSERTRAYFSTFSFSVTELWLSGKRKNRPEHVFPGGPCKIIKIIDTDTFPQLQCLRHRKNAGCSWIMRFLLRVVYPHSSEPGSLQTFWITSCKK